MQIVIKSFFFLFFITILFIIWTFFDVCPSRKCLEVYYFIHLEQPFFSAKFLLWDTIVNIHDFENIHSLVRVIHGVHDIDVVKCHCVNTLFMFVECMHRVGVQFKDLLDQ